MTFAKKRQNYSYNNRISNCHRRDGEKGNITKRHKETHWSDRNRGVCVTLYVVKNE